MANPVIEATGLTKFYGPRRGVEDVTFSVPEGEAFGFLGPNGAGKTTTIRLLLGFLRATGGEARLFGEDAFRDAAQLHAGVAYLGSDPGYLGELTGAEQLDYLAQLRGLPRRAWSTVAERLELDTGVRIKRLSRGNRQKIGVVAAFMGREPLLILDEPTSGLDPLMQREFLALVAEARTDGRTLFLSSHNLVEVERACDRVAIIRDGRIVDVSTVGELLGSHWRSINLVLAEPPAPDAFDLPNVEVAAMTGREVHLMVRGDVNPLLDRIAAHEVHDIAITTPDVEDLFLRHYRAGADEARDDRDPGGRGGAGMTALRLELRRSRSLAIWLGVSLGGYGVIMGLMYPVLKANDALMSEYMNTFPKEFLAAFGMTGVLSDPGVFYTTYISSWLWPIIAAAAALLIGTRAAADLDRGFLDLPLSTRITRVRYLSVSIVGQAIVMVLLAACAVLGLWGAGRLVGAEFDLGRFAMAGVLSLAFGCAILGATTLAAVLTLSRGMASGIVGGALIVMYVIFVVAPGLARLGMARRRCRPGTTSRPPP